MRFFLLLFALLTVVKAAFFALDHEPKFYMGDSASYLVTALEKWIPPDRSFTYGFFVRRIAVKSGSLTWLVGVQTMAGLLSSLALGWILWRHFSLRRPLVVLFSFLAAVEPIQLTLERYVMTEAVTLLTLAGMLALLFEYLRSSRLAWLAGFQLAGILLVSFRLAWLPFVFLTAVLAPLAAVRFTKSNGGTGVNRPALRRLLLHGAVSLLTLIVFHGAYCLLNGRLSGQPPAYLYADGLMQLAALSPVVKPEDAPNQAVRQVIQQEGLDLSDIDLRIGQLYSPDGLIPRLQGRIGDPLPANRLAKQTARNAMLRDPLGVLQLAWKTWSGYWKGRSFDPLLYPKLDYPGIEQILKERFQINAAEYDPSQAWTYRWYRRATPWFRLALLAPLPGLLLLWFAPAGSRRQASFLLLASISILAVVCLFSTNWSYRHLHQPSWLTLLISALLVQAFVTHVKSNRPGLP